MAIIIQLGASLLMCLLIAITGVLSIQNMYDYKVTEGKQVFDTIQNNEQPLSVEEVDAILEGVKVKYVWIGHNSVWDLLEIKKRTVEMCTGDNLQNFKRYSSEYSSAYKNVNLKQFVDKNLEELVQYCKDREQEAVDFAVWKVGVLDKNIVLKLTEQIKKGRDSVNEKRVQKVVSKFVKSGEIMYGIFSVKWTDNAEKYLEEICDRVTRTLSMVYVLDSENLLADKWKRANDVCTLYLTKYPFEA